MRIPRLAAVAAFVAAPLAVAQTAPPAGRPETAPLNRPAANSPAQAGRNALYQYLDDIAAKDEAARRDTIAKITTRAEAETRQQEVRAKILDLLGGSFQKTPLNAKVLGSTQMDGYRIEKVIYESQPKFYVTALLYLPDDVDRSSVSGARTGTVQGAGGQPSAAGQHATENGDRRTGNAPKLPAIVMAPGHVASGKAGDFGLASTFARNGFAVLSYDPIGQGERLEYPDPEKAAVKTAGDPYPGVSLATRPTGEHGEAGLQPTLIGDAVARYLAWDGMRAVDYLLSRPEIDPERIGAEGCSGGGAMTALLGALDKRIHATATACYLTTMDALLPSVGAQDGEQSIPGFIASGFDFADWVEQAAPRPYAMVGTVGDMFPWKGFLETAAEARRFYGLFDKSAEGTPTGGPLPATPTGPTLNPDTSAAIAPSAPFQVIAGIGGHGNLRPITSQIVGFFLVNLAHSNAEPIVPPPPAPGTSPAAAAAALMATVPAGALQVTPTGQVASSYPDAATVFSLNLKRAAGKIPQLPTLTLQQVQTDVRMVTKAEAVPGSRPNPPTEIRIESTSSFGPQTPGAPAHYDVQSDRMLLQTDDGITLPALLFHPQHSGTHFPAKVVLATLIPEPATGPKSAGTDEAARAPTLLDQLAADAGTGEDILLVTPRPSPPGGEEIKSPILGPFYLTELRAELVDRTLLGMRVDDVIRAVDYLASRPDVDPKNITAEASGHMGLVLLHAAVLDPRIRHVTVDHVLESYASLLRAPTPLDAPQDVLPGVLLKYDIPDLVRVLGPRVTATDWLSGTANLAAK